MERFSPTRGSPSEQLAAFNPIGYEGFSNRANPVPLPGMETVRPTGDPFAGWSNETGSARAPPSQTTTTTSGSCYAYPVPSAFDQANTQYQCSSVSPQLTRTINAAHYSIGQSQFPLVSAQVSPTSAGPGGMRYSPSHAQASQSLPRMQYSPHFSTHTQAHLGASQHPLSPVQTAIANARYSPSREDFSYEYRPTPEFISSLFATTRDLAVGNITASNNALAHASPDNQACRITGTTKLSSRSLPGGTHEVTEKHRSLIVHNVSLDATHRSIVMMFPIDEYPSLEDVCLKKFEAEGMFSFSFGDLREAIHAMKKIRLTRPTWRVFPASGEEIANFKGTNRVKGAALSSSVPQDGAFLLSVYAIPSQWLMEPMDDVVQHVAASLGTLRSCKLIENGTNMSRYQVEYFNKRHATYAFSCLGGFRLESLRFNVSIDAQEEMHILPHLRTTSFGSPQSPLTPYHLVSKESEVEEKVDISPASEEGQTSAEHAINLDRIRQGLDVRSTVMIRNIPNKITSNQLKSILDESSYGKYDFLYLRMDFTHRCNVGYAFMNFGDAIDIVNLVHARQGKTWPDCISEKRAEVSYATLQGKEALVNKFRNSNVMTRPHEERPRLFHIDGPRAGTEAAFPGPNDASKLRRSVASTTQQGLFAPRNRAPTTPRANRTRPQSQSFSQTPRGRPSIHTPRHSGGRSVQHAPGEFSSMQTEDRQFMSQKN
ncbi:Meiosis protein MEI2, putative [Penicillium digitatum Pd1]|uniref:Meiosis protein MEI2, putative n=1 Tax=Penicillium digitatum (strain Pd1 / CECT 20795) TaxID=1170230 RepID=K9GDX1_PEND1|nr:Meiosis protein MEI2, putative [Penicillium digitatum Pd1]EKV20230.1 Meiosis protein MEI2, putative [Penicillium digitatum Pd1]